MIFRVWPFPEGAGPALQDPNSRPTAGATRGLFPKIISVAAGLIVWAFLMIALGSLARRYLHFSFATNSSCMCSAPEEYVEPGPIRIYANWGIIIVLSLIPAVALGHFLYRRMTRESCEG